MLTLKVSNEKFALTQIGCTWAVETFSRQFCHLVEQYISHFCSSSQRLTTKSFDGSHHAKNSIFIRQHHLLIFVIVCYDLRDLTMVRTAASQGGIICEELVAFLPPGGFSFSTDASKSPTLERISNFYNLISYMYIIL